MSEIKITDLVPQETIEKVKELNTEVQSLLITYTNTAKELAKGLEVNVKCIGDVDKLEKLLVEKSREAADTTEKLNEALARKGKVIADTTNTIARQLMEQERVNKTQREAYTDTESFKTLLEKVNGSYENRAKRLIETNQAIASNKKQQDDLKKSLDSGRISQEQYNEQLVKLVMQERELKQIKADLNTHMKNEEREMQSVEGSYKNLSQRLELMKKAYKDLTEEELSSPLGKEMETAIQNLDAHLKDVAADMGEFQRNVGNYAIAGQKGVVATESLVAVMNQQAITMQDVADQTKILEEGKRSLDTTDAKYENIVAAINEKLAENKARLLDVNDIMGTHATSVAEAEAQNKRLLEALKNVDLTSADANEKIKELNDKINENNKIIEAGSATKSGIKKDLKELVLEIANLSLEYQNLTDEEKKSADGQALASHINDLIERAGQLKDAIADTNQAISNAASDTRGLDQLGGTLQLAADGFGLVSGAAHILGINDQELTKIQTDLQAAIATSNAIQSIQNALQSQSAVIQGANLVQTKLRTIAENLHTAAQGKGTIATAALTAAQWAFNAAASANPIGIVVVAVIACVAAVWGLVKAFQAFFGTSESAIQQYNQQKQALDDLCEANDRLIDRMKARGATEAELLSQSLLNIEAQKKATDALFERASELYDKDEDEYREALEAKKKAEEEYNKSVENSKNFFEKLITDVNAHEREQAIGTLAYKIEIIEKEKQEQLKLAEILFRNGELTREMYENIVAAVNKAAEIKIKDATEAENKKSAGKPRKSVGSNRVNDAKKQAEELKKAVEEGEDALLKIIEDSLERQRQVEILSYNRKINKLKEQLAKTKETEVTMRTAINRQIEGLMAEHESKMLDIQMSQKERHNKVEADIIESHLSIVKVGTEEELAWKQKQLSNQYQSELLAIVRAEQDKTLAVEEAEIMRTNLAIKYADLREKLESDHAMGKIQLLQNQYSAEQSDRDNAMLSEINDQKNLYLEKIKLAKGNSKKLEEAEKEYQDNCLEIQDKYARKSAEKAVELLEDVLNTENLSADEREKLERDLAKAKMDLEKLMADQAIEQIRRVEDEEEEAKDKRIKAIRYWSQVASEALNSINALGNAIFDSKIEKIENEQEAQEEAADKEQTRISELVEKKVITEEEGEARKRAAEAQTAKKNEELEKKKANLKYKQALWDKANSVAQTGINTAAALMELWVKPGWPQAIPLMAVVGALGALELSTILATPIPKYAKGTDYHKGGPAIVGDGGRHEVVWLNGDAWLTPDRPTLVDIPQGASVIPDMKLLDAIVPLTQMPSSSNASTPVLVNNDFRRLENKMDTFISLLQKQTNIQHMDHLNAEYERFKANKL